MFIDTMEFNNHFSPMGIQNFYKGTVVDNADPKKLGRVKVSITEIFGSNDKAVLPWVTSFINSPHEFNCPEVGDEIVVFFPYGVVYFPCYIGHWHLVGNHDTAFDSDYPDTVGFNRQGFSFLYNKKSKNLTITHPSGTAVAIDASGKINMNAKADITINSDTKITLKATADLSLGSDAKVDIKGAGGVSATSDAEATFSGKSKTTVGDGSSQTFVNGQMVLIAGGGVGIALMGGTCMGVGNLAIPVISTIMMGSSKVFAPL